MLSKLTYDAKYDKAMRFIFGKVLICRNLEVATKLARLSGFDCVTLEGDKVLCRGVLSGGHYDTAKSRMKIQNTRSNLNRQILQQEKELEALHSELERKKSGDNNIMNRIQTVEIDINKSR